MENQEERYKIIQKKSGLSKSAFAESLGISRAHYYHIETGRQSPPKDVLEKLASIYSVNLNWLINGSGSSGFENDYVEIELYDQEAAAGSGREVDDYTPHSSFPIPISFIYPHKSENLKAVYVSGDSMTGDNINDGDIVIFNIKQTEGNGIYVVSVGNTLVVKRVDFNAANKAIILISANPAYEPRWYTGEELHDIRIAGRVVACYHRF